MSSQVMLQVRKMRRLWKKKKKTERTPCRITQNSPAISERESTHINADEKNYKALKVQNTRYHPLNKHHTRSSCSRFKYCTQPGTYTSVQKHCTHICTIHRQSLNVASTSAGPALQQTAHHIASHLVTTFIPHIGKDWKGLPAHKCCHPFPVLIPRACHQTLCINLKISE